jgi:hypothetical protein
MTEAPGPADFCQDSIDQPFDSAGYEAAMEGVTVDERAAVAAMTADEQLDIAWWNGLTEEQRAYWLREANTAIVAEAWAYYKHVLSQLPD